MINKFIVSVLRSVQGQLQLLILSDCSITHIYPPKLTSTHTHMHVHTIHTCISGPEVAIYWWYISSLLLLDYLTHCLWQSVITYNRRIYYINSRLGKDIRKRHAHTYTHAQICMHLHMHMHDTHTCTHTHTYTHTIICNRACKNQPFECKNHWFFVFTLSLLYNYSYYHNNIFISAVQFNGFLLQLTELGYHVLNKRY